MQHVFSYFAMQISCQRACCWLTKETQTAARGWSEIKTNQTLLTQSAFLPQNKQNPAGHDALDFRSSDDPGGPGHKKRAPADSVPVERPYCAHSRIHWIGPKHLCSGAEANRPQRHIRKSCRNWQAFNLTAHSLSRDEWNEMTTVPPHTDKSNVLTEVNRTGRGTVLLC